MSLRRVLITGAGGMLGSAIRPYFRERCGEVLATDQNPVEGELESLDVRDDEAVRRTVQNFDPSLVLHLAANTDLEYCETNPDFAHQNNAVPSVVLSEISKARDVPLVYISTAGIFDGNKDGFYTEEDTPNPVMVYGQSKYDGEILVREGCERHLVIRAGWMVGGGPEIDHKFVSRILAQIADGATSLYAVDDKWGTPTYTHDFALNLFELVGAESYGTFHMVCEGAGTRYDVACEIVRICGQEVEVVPVSSDHFGEEFFAPRPRSEMMLNARLRELGLNRMRPWKDAIHEYITTYFAHTLSESRREALRSSAG